MWLCTDWKIDWNAISAVATAIAALIALFVWLHDKRQRKAERSSNAKLLAQIMTTPVGASRVLIAQFREHIFPENGSNILQGLQTDATLRMQLVEKAAVITIDLPSQFLDKADYFSESVNAKLANAFSQVSRLKQIVGLFGNLTDQATQEVIDKHLGSVLTQIKEAQDAAESAFEALMVVGRTSR